MTSIHDHIKARRHTHAFEVGRRDTIAAYRTPGRLPLDPIAREEAFAITLVSILPKMLAGMEAMRYLPVVDPATQDKADSALGSLYAAFTYYRLLSSSRQKREERAAIDTALRGEYIAPSPTVPLTTKGILS